MIESMALSLTLRDGTLTERRQASGDATVMGEEEFRAFYERTARPLWAYLSRVTGSRQEADDVMQEAYYRFCCSRVQYENEAHRRNSLFRIATNVVRDAARKAGRQTSVSLDEDEESSPQYAVQRASAEHQAAIRTDLERALTQLEPVQRELIWLAYAQGASHEEIAGILGLRTVSIRTLLFRARRKLVALLGGGAR